MVHKILLVLVLMIGPFSRSHAIVRSQRQRPLTSFFHRHRQSSLFAIAPPQQKYCYCSLWLTRAYFTCHNKQKQQRYPYHDLLEESSSCRQNIVLHLSSPVPDQHFTFGTTTEVAAATATTTRTTSSSENDHVHQPFTWPRLVELFRKTAKDTQDNENYISSDHPNLALFRRSATAQKSYEEHKQYLEKYWRTPYDYMVIRKFGEDFGFSKVVVVRRDDSLNDGGRSCEHNGDIIIIDQPDNECTMHQASTSLSQASKYAIQNQITYLSLVLNEFPYDVEQGIEHWCLWKIGGASISEGIVNEELVWAMRELKCLRPDESSGSWCIYHRGGVDAATAATSSRMSLLDGSNISYVRQRGNTPRPMPIADSFYWVNPPHLQSMPEIHHAHILVLRSEESRDDGDCASRSPPV